MAMPLQEQLEALAEKLSVFSSSKVRRKSLVISFLLAIVGPAPVQGRSVALLWPQMLAFFAAEEWVSRNMIAFRVASLDVPQLLQVISCLEMSTDASTIMAGSQSGIWIDAQKHTLVQAILPLLQNQVVANFEQPKALPLKVVLERSLANDPQWSQGMVIALTALFNLDLPNVPKSMEPISESDLLPQDDDNLEIIAAQEKAKALQLQAQKALDTTNQKRTEDEEIAKSEEPIDHPDFAAAKADHHDMMELENKDLRSKDSDSNPEDAASDSKDAFSDSKDSKSKDAFSDSKDSKSKDAASDSKDSKREGANPATEPDEYAEDASVLDSKSKSPQTRLTSADETHAFQNQTEQLGRKELDVLKVEEQIFYDANQNPWHKRKKDVGSKTRKSLRLKKADPNLSRFASAAEKHNSADSKKPLRRYIGHTVSPIQKSEAISPSDLQGDIAPVENESFTTHRRRIQPKPNAYSRARRMEMAEEMAQMRIILGIAAVDKPTVNRQKLQKQETEAAAPAAKREPKREPSYPYGNSWGSDKIHYVENAGLVLLNPFFQPCFEDLGWVVKGEFVDEEAQENAVLLVAYMACGDLEIPESYLPLAKVLCGMEVGRPVRMEVDLEQRALDEANALLEAAAGYWEKAGKMSPDQLRGAFLMREGRLQDIMSGWNLKVDRQTIDILLEFLPWSFGTIKLPWMRQIFTVDW
jgi:Contractile injection system tape measure protein